MNLTKKRWSILVASCLINLCIGSLYAWSVFAAPMASHLGQLNGCEITASDLAIVFTVANSVGPITMICGGKVNELLGTRLVVLIGGLMFGGGMLLSGFATSRATLIVGYGLLTGLGMGATYGCTISNTIKFFPDKKGLIGGIATATYGLSSVLIPPIANMLIGAVGVSNSFKAFGATFMLLIGACSLCIEKCPDGFSPEGWKTTATGQSSTIENKKWTQMLATPIFYVMILMMTCGAFSGMMCISQTSNIAQSKIGLSTASSAMMVSMLALFNAAGRVGAGFISDRIGRVSTLRIALACSLVGLVLLYCSGLGQAVIFGIGVALIGISFGSFMGVYPGFTMDQFGSKYNGVNYGIMFIGFATAGCLGPVAMSAIFSAAGNYQPAFLVAMSLSCVGLLLSLQYGRMARKHIS